jgi:integrase
MSSHIRNQRDVDRALAAKPKEQFIPILHAPAAYLRIRKSGFASWTISRKFPGGTKQETWTIGNARCVPLIEFLRLYHSAMRVILIDNKDPRPDKNTKTRLTLGAWFETYKRNNLSKLRKGRETEAILLKMKELFDRPIDSIEAKEFILIRNRIRDEGDGGHIPAAKRFVSAARTMLESAKDDLLISKNPIAEIKMKGTDWEETPRNVVLSFEQIGAILRANGRLRENCGATSVEGITAVAFEIIWRCGARRSEVTSMQWSELDFVTKLWIIPPGRMKGAKAHSVPITDKMAELIQSLPRLGPYVFSSDGSTPVNSWSRFKSRLDREVEKELGAPLVARVTGTEGTVSSA